MVSPDGKWIWNGDEWILTSSLKNSLIEQSKEDLNSLEEFPKEKPSSTFHHPRASNSSSDVDEHSLSNNQECNFCNLEQPSISGCAWVVKK